MRDLDTADVLEVDIVVGLPGAGLWHATAASRVWVRGGGETEGEFRRRVRAEARDIGASAVTFGGLPPK